VTAAGIAAPLLYLYERQSIFLVFALQDQMHREYEMKRFDLPDMSHREMDDLLRSQLLCRITFNDRPYPYTLPMEYYYFGDTMYFHFTTTGKKMDLMRGDPNVCVEVDWSNDDLSDYKSVIIRGRLIEVIDTAERNTMNLAMSGAIKDKVGIKAFLRIPWAKKGIDYLSASNIPLTLYKLEVKDMTGKKAH
jgi:nitroimidazol reductase NimA-like FMN-containing flavoprotein (pyridoxamine 5'-phosphate oxidase superfamily)